MLSSELPARPFVIGHRGGGARNADGGFLENTVAGCVNAVAQGASWVEVDVRLNAERELVLSHDVHPSDRVPVFTMTCSACRQAGLATLEQVHAALPPEVGICLEVKVGVADATGPAAVDACIAWVAAHRDERPVLLISLDPSVAAAAAAYRLPTGWLTWIGWAFTESVTSAARLGCAVAVCHAPEVVASFPDADLGPEVLRELLERTGVRLWVYDALADHVPALLAAGVTGLITDDVAGVVAALAAHERNTPS